MTGRKDFCSPYFVLFFLLCYLCSTFGYSRNYTASLRTVATPESKPVPISRTMTPANYETAIKDLRKQLSVTYTRNRGVLTRLVPDETTGIEAFRKNAKWFDIVLQLDKNTNIYLRVRQDNLYLYGYRVNNGKWFELRKDGPNTWCIAQDSKALGFGHSYSALLGASNYKSKETIKLGRDELVTVAEKLRGDVTTPEQRRATAGGLLTVIFMFCEASRLEEVLSYTKRTFDKSASTTKSWMIEQVNKWGPLSYAVLKYDQEGGSKWDPRTIAIEGNGPPYPTVVLRSVDAVLQYVALLQRDPRTIPPPHSIFKANM